MIVVDSRTYTHTTEVIGTVKDDCSIFFWRIVQSFAIEIDAHENITRFTPGWRKRLYTFTIYSVIRWRRLSVNERKLIIPSPDCYISLSQNPWYIDGCLCGLLGYLQLDPVSLSFSLRTMIAVWRINKDKYIRQQTVRTMCIRLELGASILQRSHSRQSCLPEYVNTVCRTIFLEIL